MKIRTKIVFIVIPLIVTPLVLTGVLSFYAARNGITTLAVDFLRFKSEELRDYADSQWNLLLENDLTKNPQFIEATKAAIESYAKGLIRNETELIIGVDENGKAVMQTSAVQMSDTERQMLMDMIENRTEGWQQIALSGEDRVSHNVIFAPLGLYFVVTEHREVFYRSTSQILQQMILILSISSLISVFLLLLFSYYLIDPLTKVIVAMKNIIKNGDLSKRVAIIFQDETGELGHTFNIMTGELETAYGQIKSYALKAVIAQYKEQKIRNIFQKYVPKNVIDRFFKDPESMLVGETRILAVLFTDIRSFTTISEKMRPDEIVDSLNIYFGMMVEIIMSRNGIVDKYIGDAIMAFFGAPVRHEDDAYQAVVSGFDMEEALKKFNRLQAEHNRPPFRMGIGINYGGVTVGNIGSEKKMDYTVIGDMVNVASRLEGLTKVFREPMIISESVQSRVKDKVPCRLLSRVVVKGRAHGLGIYTPRRSLTDIEKKAWEVHHGALDLYYKKEFGEAAQLFQEVQTLLPGDTCSKIFVENCQDYLTSPPPADWNGLMVMETK